MTKYAGNPNRWTHPQLYIDNLLELIASFGQGRMMNRYLVFKFSGYDESGGWNDFVSAHDDILSALVSAERIDGHDHAQVVDLETLKVVEERWLWKDGGIMVSETDHKKLAKEREEFIAARQRERGLIA